MSSLHECSTDEDIVCAICLPHYDVRRARPSSALFCGNNISVSRLVISPLATLIDVFQEELASEEKPLLKVGEINVGTLQHMGRDHSPSSEMSVAASPTPTNPAHAEIPQKISRGLAKKIVRALKLHDVALPS